MDVQTFEAYTMKDAVKAVKKALGPDAVILSTREKKNEGGPRIFEVTAAAATQSRSETPRRDFRPSHLEYASSGRFEEAMTNLSVRLGDLKEGMPTRRQVQAIETGLAEIKLLLLEGFRSRAGSTMPDLPPAIADVDRQLRMMGIDESAICDLLRHLRALPEPAKGQEEPNDYYRNHAMRWMLKRIKIAPRWQPIPGIPSVMVFLGSPGAGKTTTVAKLAALHKIKDKRKVLVVSLDNRRLAASEQMRVFTKVIGVPFRALGDATELKGCLTEHSDCELVLIDTAGRSAKEIQSCEALEELKALSQAGAPTDFHLTLSVTEKESQLDQAIRAFAPLGLASLVFTKLDESWSYGEIFNLSRRWTLPLSFFSIGQDVPDDIERATRERVIERIFGL